MKPNSRFFLLMLINGIGFVLFDARSLDIASERLSASVSEIPGKLVVYGHTSGAKEGTELAGQLPPDDENSGFVVIAGHQRTWGGLRLDGGGHFSGFKFEPQLSDLKSRPKKLSVSGAMIAAMDDEGNGYVWHENGRFPNEPSTRLQDIVDIHAGVNQGYALSREGRIIWWGGVREWENDRAEIFAPYQKSIIAIDCRERTGILLHRTGEIFMWRNQLDKNFEKSFASLQPSIEQPFLAVEGKYFLTTTSQRGLAGETMFAVEKWPEHITRGILYPYGLGVFEISPRTWQVVTSNPSAEEGDDIQRFLDLHRPSAIAIVGLRKLEDREDTHGFGVVAIVPEESVESPPVAPTANGAITVTPVDPAPNHDITDSRFLDLLEVYQLETAARVTEPHEAEVSALSKKLDAALALEEKDAIEQGDLERVTAIIAERKALEARKYPPAELTTLERIQQLREIWNGEIEKLTESSSVNRALLQRDFVGRLDDLIRTLTQERKIEEAMKVKTFRDRQ